MEKIKKVNIIAGIINGSSILGLVLVFIFCFLLNMLLAEKTMMFPSFVALMFYIMAYICSIFYLLTFLYFIGVFVYSIVLLFSNKEKEIK